MQDNAENRSKGWVLTALLVICAVVSYTNRQVITLIVEPLKTDMQLDDTQVSLLIGTSFAIVYALFSLIFGWLADLFSRTLIIGWAVLVWSAASCASGFAHSFEQLFILRMVIGATEAALIPAALSLIGEHFPPERRGLATGIFLMGVYSGAGGSILLVGFLLGLVAHGVLQPLGPDAHGWRQVFVLVAAPGLLLGPIMLMLKDRRAGRSAVAHADGASSQSSNEPPPQLGSLPWATIAAVCGGLTLLSLSDNAVLAWLPSVLIRSFHQSAEFVGTYLGISLMLGGGLGVLIGGVFADRATRSTPGRTLISACGALLALPFLFSLLSSSSALIIATFGVYIAISAGATAAGVSSLLGIVPPRRRGLVTSMITLGGVAVGMGVAPTVTIFASERLGSLALGLLVVSVTSLLLAAMAFWIPKRRTIQV